MRNLGEVAVLLHRGRPPGRELSPADLASAVSWMEEVLRQLGRLHARGAFHGNVGPDAVRIGPRGARLAPVGEAEAPPEFRDPERERMRLKDRRTALAATPRHDLYGAGALLFTLLDGGPPPCGPASAFTRRVPPALAFVVARALAEGPARYPDAETMRRDLERFRRLARDREPDLVRPEELPSHAGGPARPAARLAPFAVRRRREGRRLGALLLLGLLLTGAGWALPRGGGAPAPEPARGPEASWAGGREIRDLPDLLAAWRARLDDRLKAVGGSLDPVEVPLLVVGDADPGGELGWPRHPSRRLAREVEEVLAAGGGAREVQEALLRRLGADTLPAVLRLTRGSPPGTVVARLYYRGVTLTGRVGPPPGPGGAPGSRASRCTGTRPGRAP